MQMSSSNSFFRIPNIGSSGVEALAELQLRSRWFRTKPSARRAGGKQLRPLALSHDRSFFVEESEWSRLAASWSSNRQMFRGPSDLLCRA